MYYFAPSAQYVDIQVPEEGPADEERASSSNTQDIKPRLKIQRNDFYAVLILNIRNVTYIKVKVHSSVSTKCQEKV